MKHLKGNAIDYVFEDVDNRILLHCVNAQGKMNSGIAKEVRERIPDAYTNYMRDYKLGDITFDDDCIVVNMCAQEFYGYDGKRYVDYGMLAKCLFDVRYGLGDIEYVIPYKMCSDRAGGDWGVVLELCKDILGEENITVVEYDGS